MHQPSKVSLSKEEKSCLKRILKNPRSSQTLRHRSELLLAMDASKDGVQEIQIAYAQKASISVRTVRNILAIYHQKGFKSVINLLRSPNSDNARRKFFPETEAIIASVARSRPPEGNHHWTILLLAKVLLEEHKIQIGRETLRRYLKKNGIHAYHSRYWRVSKK